MGDYGQNIAQQGDVLHFDTDGGGDIGIVDYLTQNMTGGPDYTGFQLRMTTGPESMLYDCLFGGNRDDDGTDATIKNQWSGNEGEKEEHRSRGRLQSLISGRPLTSALLPMIEDAARDDIISNAPSEAVSDVVATASIAGSRRADLLLDVLQPDGTVYRIEIKGVTS